MIVGAGLSGLSCALTLHQAGIPFQLLEASNAVGGRVRSDNVDGFTLDRGFQVYLSAYPAAGKLLDTEALQLHRFEPGALVFDGKKCHRVMDVFRRPTSLVTSALAPIGSMLDKLRVAKLRWQLSHQSETKIAHSPDQSTDSFLRAFGFSPRMIDSFFRCFYGGIFLENALDTSSRMFAFTFKMFTQGHATLPANGMGAIPAQLAANLPNKSIRTDTPVASVSTTSVTLADGSELQARAVVIATAAHHAAQWLPQLQAPEWRATTNLYFSAPTSPIQEAIIALNGSGHGSINSVCVPSDVCPHYAPSGSSLISVTLLGDQNQDTLIDSVLEELSHWFGPEVNQWHHLRTDSIPHALPTQNANQSPSPNQIDGIYLCGDHTHSASIEGAIRSGIETAESFIHYHTSTHS